MHKNRTRISDVVHCIVQSKIAKKLNNNTFGIYIVHFVHEKHFIYRLFVFLCIFYVNKTEKNVRSVRHSNYSDI